VGTAVIVNVTSSKRVARLMLIGLLHNYFIEPHDSSDLCLN